MSSEAARQTANVVLSEVQELLLLYRAADHLGKVLPDKLIPHYTLALAALAKKKLWGMQSSFYFSYCWHGDGPSFKDDHLVDLEQAGYVRSTPKTTETVYHFLTVKGVTEAEELVKKYPDEYKAIKNSMGHLTNVEHELPFLSWLIEH